MKQRKASFHVFFRKATDRGCGGGAASSLLTAGGGGACSGREEERCGAASVGRERVCSSEGIEAVCGPILAVFSVDEALTH